MSDYSGSKITAIGRQFPIGTVYNYVEDVVIQSKSSCNVPTYERQRHSIYIL